MVVGLSGVQFELIRSAIVQMNSEFTQQDGRKKRTTKHLSVTNVTGLLLSRFVVILNYINVFWFFTKVMLYKIICHACYTRFAVLFPLPSCCVRLLFFFPRFIFLLAVKKSDLYISASVMSHIILLNCSIKAKIRAVDIANQI